MSKLTEHALSSIRAMRRTTQTQRGASGGDEDEPHVRQCSQTSPTDMDLVHPAMVVERALVPVGEAAKNLGSRSMCGYRPYRAT